MRDRTYISVTLHLRLSNYWQLDNIKYTLEKYHDMEMQITGYSRLLEITSFDR